MCSCWQANNMEPLDKIDGITETVVSAIQPGATGTVATAIADAIITVGPQVARQWMRYSNQTVADKVPEEMLHLIDPHWCVWNVQNGTDNIFCECGRKNVLYFFISKKCCHVFKTSKSILKKYLIRFVYVCVCVCDCVWVYVRLNKFKSWCDSIHSMRC